MERKNLLILIIHVICVFSLFSQSKLIHKDGFLYTEINLFNNKIASKTTSLIDTGCSLCLIDSTYAVTALNLSQDALTSIPINKDHKSMHSFDLDSLIICGQTINNVKCVYVDLKTLFGRYAPNFIIGANVLKNHVWRFDYAKGVIEIDSKKNNDALIKLKWKSHNDYKDVAFDYIVLDGIIDGNKSRFIFDTGSKYNKLATNINLNPSKIIEKETANIYTPLFIQETFMYENIPIKLDKYTFSLNFIHNNYNNNNYFNILNLDFIGEHSFILDYPKRQIKIIE